MFCLRAAKLLDLHRVRLCLSEPRSHLSGSLCFPQIGVEGDSQLRCPIIPHPRAGLDRTPAAAFGYLYRRFRDTRTLLWFLGFLFALARMLSFYPLGWQGLPDAFHPWLVAFGQTSILISSALFLASLSPARFQVGRFNVLYVVPFAVPLIAYSILLYGVFKGVAPQGPLFFVFPALGLAALVPCVFWAKAKSSLPARVGVSCCVVCAPLGLWSCFRFGAAWPLLFVECANHLMTALLLIFVFRRFSPGVALSVLGFTAWSLTFLEIFPAIASNDGLRLILIRIVVMAKVVAALGMILLALEDELAKNKATGDRERRARQELEAYANLILSRRRVKDFDLRESESARPLPRTAGLPRPPCCSKAPGDSGWRGLPVWTPPQPQRSTHSLRGFLLSASWHRALPLPPSTTARLSPWTWPLGLSLATT